MNKTPIKFSHLLLAFVPLTLTPVVIYTLAEGWIDLGGGEKDILMALPYFLLTCIFFITAFVLILKRWHLCRWVLRATTISVGLLFCLWAILYLIGRSGIA